MFFRKPGHRVSEPLDQRVKIVTLEIIVPSLICTQLDKNLQSYSANLKLHFSYYAILATCCSVTMDFILDTH